MLLLSSWVLLSFLWLFWLVLFFSVCFSFFSSWVPLVHYSKLKNAKLQFQSSRLKSIISMSHCLCLFKPPFCYYDKYWKPRPVYQNWLVKFEIFWAKAGTTNSNRPRSRHSSSLHTNQGRSHSRPYHVKFEAWTKTTLLYLESCNKKIKEKIYKFSNLHAL